MYFPVADINEEDETCYDHTGFKMPPEILHYINCSVTGAVEGQNYLNKNKSTTSEPNYINEASLHKRSQTCFE